MDDRETQRRRLKFVQIQRAERADATFKKERDEVEAARVDRHTEAVALLRQLGTDHDFDAFRSALDAWSRLPGSSSFAGFGMMFLHQLAKMATDQEEAARLVFRALSLPASEADARAKIDELLAFV